MRATNAIRRCDAYSAMSSLRDHITRDRCWRIFGIFYLMRLHTITLACSHVVCRMLHTLPPTPCCFFPWWSTERLSYLHTIFGWWAAQVNVQSMNSWLSVARQGSFVVICVRSTWLISLCTCGGQGQLGSTRSLCLSNGMRTNLLHSVKFLLKLPHMNFSSRGLRSLWLVFRENVILTHLFKENVSRWYV